MLRSSQDENLKRVFSELTTEQRLVNVIFDEVKLKSTLRLSSGHILGYVDNESDRLATAALAFEAVTHRGRLFVLLISPVSHPSTQLSYKVTLLKY